MRCAFHSVLTLSALLLATGAGWGQRRQDPPFQQPDTVQVKRDIVYGKGGGRDLKLDLFLPKQGEEPRPGIVFVHGGGWQGGSRAAFQRQAAYLAGKGYVGACIEYRLSGEATFPAAIEDCKCAVRWLRANAGTYKVDPERIAACGGSAGGHLVCRVMTSTSPLPEAVRRRVAHVLSISGVHDLRPLMSTRMNATLRLDRDEARAESPVLLEPSPGLRLTCWAGASERAEFIRQNALLANIWRGLGAATACVVEDNRHHFNVIDGLGDRDSPLTKALFET